VSFLVDRCSSPPGSASRSSRPAGAIRFRDEAFTVTYAIASARPNACAFRTPIDGGQFIGKGTASFASARGWPYRGGERIRHALNTAAAIFDFAFPRFVSAYMQ
jgi:hypothetical protein